MRARTRSGSNRAGDNGIWHFELTLLYFVASALEHVPRSLDLQSPGQEQEFVGQWAVSWRCYRFAWQNAIFGFGALASYGSLYDYFALITAPPTLDNKDKIQLTFQLTNVARMYLYTCV